MCLVQIMIRILSENHGLDVRQRRVPRPAVDIFAGREDFLAAEGFVAEEALQVEEGLGGEVVLKSCKPGFVQSLDFELEELLFFVAEFGEPGLFVEGEGRGGGCRGRGGGLGWVDGGVGCGFGLAELWIE